MLKFQSLAVLICLSLWLMLRAKCEGYMELTTTADCKYQGEELASPLAVKMVSTSDDKQDNITFSMIGLPAYDIKAYDLEEKSQRIRGNINLPRASDKQLRNAIESLMKTPPELGNCWTLSGSLRNVDKVKIPPLSWNDHVLTTLLCFNDILDPVLINAEKDSCKRKAQQKAQRELKKNCTASDGLFIVESTPTTECYRTLPCAFCKKIVIEIRRDDKLVWNHVTEAVGEFNCATYQPVIPATSVFECFRKGGRYIMNAQVPDKKVRCVSNNCEATTKEPLMEVNYLNLRYNKCNEEEVEKAEPKEYGQPTNGLSMTEELQIQSQMNEYQNAVKDMMNNQANTEPYDPCALAEELSQLLKTGHNN